MDSTTKVYFISHGYYYDCPSCDGHSSDPEDVRLDRVEGLTGIQKWIQEHFQDRYTFHIYELLEYGEMVKVSDLDAIIGEHRVHGMKFKLNDQEYIYKYDKDSMNYLWNSDVHKVLFGQSND